MAGRETSRFGDFTKVLQKTDPIRSVRSQRPTLTGCAPGRTPVGPFLTAMFEFLFADAVFFHKLVKLAGGHGRLEGRLFDASVVPAEKLLEITPFDLGDADPADLGQPQRRVKVDLG